MRTFAKRLVRVGVVCAALAVCGSYFDGDATRPPSGAILRAAGPCDSPANAIVAENCKPGSPATEWDLPANTSGDANIQGFATEMSVNRGGTIAFKIDVNPVTSIRLDIYRMGYYQGLGARKVASITVAAPPTQPACQSDPATGLVDCGNWFTTEQWPVPSDATSGIYFAKAIRTGATAGASHIFFVVRDDASTSDLVVKTSDTTWQAYNTYGVGGFGTGSSFYAGQAPVFRGYKLSYNRPFDTRGNGNARSFVFSAEYPMVRWLEANGYDTSYIATADLARGLGLSGTNPILQHKIFVSSGHDEYWSGEERASAEAARAAGKHLAFFSGNEMYWKTRWESSHRTLVSYKETWANAKIDPTGTWTGTWRDPRFSPPADGGRPENALTGQIWTVNCCTENFKVPAADGQMRFWRHTPIASLAAGGTATLPFGTLGYEWDEDLDNGFRPAGIVRMSTSTATVPERMADYGNTFPPGSATHHLTLYRHNTRNLSGTVTASALVFGAGTVQWAWGLDEQHDGNGNPADVRMQQATVNLLADMGVQPRTLQAGLSGGNDPSLDTTPPTSTVTFPASSFTVTSGVPVTITGTATDTGGRVGGVEVSVDGGASWHPAVGRETWSYTWMPGSPLPTVIKSRAVDDSANLETAPPSSDASLPSNAVSGTVNPATVANCPCSLWDAATSPVIALQNDTNAVEIGVRFQADADGYITALRFYKGAGNAGTHVGHLWTGAGTLLASATVVGETASGWQQVLLSSPVAITRNTTYVASYHSTGGYAFNPVYFDQVGYDHGLLHAPRSVAGAGNGVFRYGASGFPTQSSNAANYWVDVVFTGTLAPDTTAPVISAIGSTPISATSASVQWNTDELSTSRVSYGVSPDALTSSVTQAQPVTLHAVTLTNLQADTVYYYRVTSSDSAAVPNSSTAPAGAPATFVLSSASVVDTTVAQFGAGARDASAYIGQAGNGELLLTPTEGQEFSGSTLPAGWSSEVWTTGGSATVAGGQLILDGARAGTNARYGPGRSLEFVANFSGQPFEHVGFATTFNSAPWAMFTTASDGAALYARTLGTEAPPTAIPGNYFGAPHLYRIDWNSDFVVFSIDGAMVATHELSVSAPLSPGGSDFNFGGGTVSIDWVRMSPYAASSTFVSRVLDAGGDTNWGGLSWTSTTPAGTTLDISVRMGNTPVPDGTWSGFTPVLVSGTAIGGRSRYIQYRAQLATTNAARTPVLSEVSIGHGFVTVPPDTIAPVISNVTANPTSSYTSAAAVITWTTSELADSRVVYGTTPGALTGLGVNAASLVAHSIAITGLAPNTQYYYRVTSTDAAGNAATSPVTAVAPATFTTPPLVPPTFIDTTSADFGAGTPDATTYLAETANGEVRLAPAAGSEFSGSALAAGWQSGPWDSGGGTATVGGGVLTVDGARVSTTSGFTAGRSLEFVATFNAQPFQNIGFVTDHNFSAPWAMFTTYSMADGLWARTGGTNGTDTLIPGNWLGTPHRYRIDWTATNVVFWIDGVQVATHSAAALGPNLRPVVSDATVGGQNLTVNWLRMTPYAATGTFVSRVFDSGAPSTWGSISWTSDLPAGTALTLRVRTGDTPSPDASWSAFSTIASNGGIIGGRSRYLQYQAVLTTSDGSVTPTLQDVTIGFTGQALTNSAPVARDDTYSTNEDTTLSVAASGVIANDTDVDGNPLTATRIGALPAHGSLTFAADGGFIYVPSLNFHGTDSFSYTVNDGIVDSNVATVTITVNPVNDAPVAVNDSYATDEDVPLNVGVANGVLANDSDVDGDALTAVLVSAPGHGSLALNANGSFEYSPVLNFNGPDSFSYRATDASLSSTVATVSITVRPVNDAPVAVADSKSTNEDTPLTFPASDLTANDTDVEADALTVTAVTNGAKGTATLANGSITYTPNADVNGQDSFTYTVSDGHGGTATGTVTMTIIAVNDAPVAVNDTATTDEDIPITIAVLANDTDPDAGDTKTVATLTQPANGSASLNANGTVTYTPNLNFYGTNTFTYTIKDSAGAVSNAATVTVTVRPVNDAPIANNDAYTTTMDIPLNVPAPGVLGNDTDVDGDPLIAQVVTQPGHGTLTLNGNGSLTYTPAAGYVGPDSFTYVANDGKVSSGAATVSITVARPPTIITWANPAAVPLNTALSYIQLNATANTAGTFVYTPALGTVLNTAGTQTLSVTFTPTDTARYTTTTKSVQINVVAPGTQTMTSSLAVSTPSVQYSDVATFTATVTSSVAGQAPAGKVAFKVGTQAVGVADLTPVGNPQTTTSYQAVWSGQLLEPSPAGTMPTGQMKPSLKVVSAVMLDPDPRFAMTNPANKSMTISLEDARVAYAGSSTTLSLSGGTTVPLTASMTELADSNPGDIKMATVQFINRATNAVLGTATVGADGKATYVWTAPAGTYSIGFAVGNYYTRNNVADNVSITVTP